MGASGKREEAAATAHEATMVLQRLADGDSGAAAELFPVVYNRLRTLASNYFRNQKPDQTLQPTALVHEAFLKLVKPREAGYNDREHFFAVAATAMRQILRDRARARRAAKRGGDMSRVTLESAESPAERSIVDVVALDEALTRLAALDSRQSRIVELRFFGGLTNDEVAQVLGLSSRTIELEWRRTRAWLSAQLAGDTAL